MEQMKSLNQQLNEFQFTWLYKYECVCVCVCLKAWKLWCAIGSFKNDREIEVLMRHLMNFS